MTHRFEYNLVPSSCDGDPAPNLALPMVPGVLLRPFGPPNGDLTLFPLGGSIGEVFVVDDPDLG